MPVNESDLLFFDLLMNMMPTETLGAPSIMDVRNLVKKFSRHVDAPADLPFEDHRIFTPSGKKIRLRYYSHHSRLSPLIIYRNARKAPSFRAVRSARTAAPSFDFNGVFVVVRCIAE